MKKNLFIAAILCGSCICANAASMVTEWTGNAGPTEGNTYELGNADNWSNGVPARGNNQGPDVIFNNTGTITLSGSMVDTSDGGSIPSRATAMLRLGEPAGREMSPLEQVPLFPSHKWTLKAVTSSWTAPSTLVSAGLIPAATAPALSSALEAS